MYLEMESFVPQMIFLIILLPHVHEVKGSSFIQLTDLHKVKEIMNGAVFRNANFWEVGSQKA